MEETRKAKPERAEADGEVKHAMWTVDKSAR